MVAIGGAGVTKARVEANIEQSKCKHTEARRLRGGASAGFGVQREGAKRDARERQERDTRKASERQERGKREARG
jgi:hypothetical protein